MTRLVLSFVGDFERFLFSFTSKHYKDLYPYGIDVTWRPRILNANCELETMIVDEEKMEDKNARPPPRGGTFRGYGGWRGGRGGRGGRGRERGRVFAYKPKEEEEKKEKEREVGFRGENFAMACAEHGMIKPLVYLNSN